MLRNTFFHYYKIMTQYIKILGHHHNHHDLIVFALKNVAALYQTCLEIKLYQKIEEKKIKPRSEFLNNFIVNLVSKQEQNKKIS